MSQGQTLVAVIGDEDTVAGFLLAGTGERTVKGETNFLVVEDGTTQQEIEKAFIDYTTRKNISVILINQHVSPKVF